MIIQINPTTLTTISEVNQTAVPALVRKILKVKRGDKLVWQIDESSRTVMVKEAPKDWGTYLLGAGIGVYGDVQKYIDDLRRDRTLP
ncbi:hypothetical protein A2153_05180 [Candidatus Gottesmanbacteria bacterium RBG_16_38_7b]|uniref:SpoVT-AbrB domain-containing protein n=1 Tax=Candidatus Gottesmanbacteria bacterium RBG_16_38_7b TaxID=1798372 RepID=A0A1F5YHB3_9BACT|nr:MAG: hypothetical protein A2153_05180 [Candidatus Gottesmanbacteria bacterium RBG_16_38_7b]